MNNIILAFIISTIAGLSTLIGTIVVFIAKNKNNNILISSLSFASGVMATLSITDLLPEGIRYISNNFYIIPAISISLISISIGGIISIIIDKLLPNKLNSKNNNNNLYKIGIISMLAIILHNIPEGIATFITSTDNIKLGITIAIAITLHNIPEGISIAIPIYYSTNSKRKAFIYTLISGLSEPLGALIAYLFLAPFITKLFLGIIFSLIAGIMLHISLIELLPASLSYKKKKLSYLFFILGIIFVLINHFFF